LGGYAKQISATMNNTVYAIGQADSVFVNRGAGFVPLGGYVKQISASLDATGKPEVFAIGRDDALYVHHATGPDGTGSGLVRLGGYATDVSAPAVGIALPGDQAYIVGMDHGGSLHRGTSFIAIGGYIQTPSGSTSNGTNSWAPVTRDTSAVSWASNGVAHNTLYAIGSNDKVEVSTDGGSFTSLNFYAKQISASLDASGKPEVYAIASDNSVAVNRSGVWTGLGGYVKQISATVANTVYAIGKDNGVYINRGTGTGLFPVGGVGGYAKQISAGADAAGNPEVFGIGA